MANFQTVYAILSLLISLMLISSFIVQAAVPHDGSADEIMRTNGAFYFYGSITAMFITLIGSITVLVLQRKR
jgi:hypothetical protein